MKTQKKEDFEGDFPRICGELGLSIKDFNKMTPEQFDYFMELRNNRLRNKISRLFIKLFSI